MVDFLDYSRKAWDGLVERKYVWTRPVWREAYRVLRPASRRPASS